MMIRSVCVLALLASILAFCQCNASTGPIACELAYQACVSKIGPFCGADTCSKAATDDGEDSEPTPWYGPDAYGDNLASVCTAPTTDEGPCVACVTSTCCEAAVTCFSDAACTCLVSQPGAASCGPPDAAYQAAVACFSGPCAADCGESK